MRNLWTVYRKELAEFFHRPHAYVFIGMYFFLCAFFFNQALQRFTQGMLNLIRQNPNLLDMINLNDHLFQPFSYTMGVVLLFVIVVLTMGSFAEERSKGTYELLMTAPVKLFELIIGKFLASLTVFVIALALTWIFPIFLWKYGNMEMAPVWTAYLGLFLAGAAFIAIGVFWSSVFESQVVAALVTFGNLLLFWLVGMADSGDSSFVSELARNLSAVMHLLGFTKGVLELKDVVFYVTVAAFFLFLTHRALEWHRWGQGPSRKVTSFYGKFAGIAALPFLVAALAIRYISAELQVIFWSVLGIGLLALILFVVFELSWVKELFSRKSALYGANTVVYSFIVAAIAVLVNVMVLWKPAKLDLTADKLYTLNDKTINLLKNLDKDVKITAFYQKEVIPESKMMEDLKELIEQYRQYTGKIDYEIVDPNENPALAKKYNITLRGERIIVESGDMQARVERPTEEALTNGLLKVTKQGGRSVCFTTGHGEADPESTQANGYSEAKKLLESDRYKVEKLDLIHEGEKPQVPDRCKVVVAAGPRYPFQEPEIKALKGYLKSGGRVLFLIEPDTKPAIDSLLEEYGITLHEDHVVDVGVRLQDASPYTVTAQRYGRHDITKGLGGFAFSKFPMARSMEKAVNPPPMTTVTELVQTTARSFGETELTQEGPKYDPDKDKRGPLTIALASEKRWPSGSNDSSKRTRLVVFGDADFASNAHLHFLVNGVLFENSVNWLAEQTDLISFPAKRRKGSTLFLTENQKNLILVSTVLLVPLAVILAGLFVRMARRGK